MSKRKLLQLVTAVIDLSKIERAQLTLESMVVDLGDTFQDVANEFELYALFTEISVGDAP